MGRNAISFKFIFVTLIGIALSLFVPKIYAEGTKEIQPAPASHGRLQIMPYVTEFAMLNAAHDQRLHITIGEIGEKIYYGFGYIRDYYGNIQYDVVYRIKDPSGNVVVGPASVPYSGAGFISSYNAAVNGPSVINPTGYNALSYTPVTIGDFYIEFSFTQPYGYERKIFDLFDVSVVSASNQIKKGRLWSKNWQLTTNPMTGYSSPYQAGYDGVMFIYSDDGVVTSVDLNNMQPFVFNITANQSGCFNTGNFLQDRKSTDGNHTYPQYRIFLNDPDSIYFPSGNFGNFSAPTTITGCPGQFCINIHVDKPGNVEVLLDLNGIPGYQSNSSDVLVSFNVQVGHNCIPWNGLDGLGNIVLSGSAVSIAVNYFNGLTHLPLYDVEGNANGYKVKIVRPYNPNPIPNLFWDDTDIPGGSLQLTGCSNPNGCHTWSIGSCLSTPVPTYCSLGDMRTINTWWYAQAINDTAIVNFEYPVANANSNTPIGQNDTIVCVENSSLQLNGSVQFALSGFWSGGAGAFLPSDSSLQAVYSFSQSEIDNGAATLILTSSGSNCPAVSDTMHITIVGANIAVSNDKTICRGNSVMISATGGTSYMWTPEVYLDNPQASSPMASPLNDIVYTVNMTDNYGCTASEQVAVFVEDVPDIDFTPDVREGCKPLKVNFQSFSNTQISSYNWVFGDPSSGSSNTSSSSAPSHVYNTSGSYSVSLSVTSSAGCSNHITYTNLIYVYPQPIASFYNNPKEGGPDNMLINFINESVNSVQWHWNFGDNNAGVDNNSVLENPQHLFLESGTYNVTLNVTSSDGCIDSTSRNILIRGIFTFYVPNAFTPNGDGVNDYFMPYGISLDNNHFEMYIYTRWGELIYQTDDVNRSWNGKVMGTNRDVPQGVYTWIIWIENYIVGRQKYTGHVTLLR